jgi:hypothetical protein
LIRGQMLWGIVLIIVGLLVGPGGVSLFTLHTRAGERRWAGPRDGPFAHVRPGRATLTSTRGRRAGAGAR